MRTRGYLYPASLVLWGLTGPALFAQSVIDLDDPERLARVTGSVLDLDRPVETQRAAVSREMTSPAVNVSPSPARHPVGQPEIEDMILEVGLHYITHPALRQSGMSGRQWLAFFRANVAIESAFNPSARSEAGAIGLGQLMPDTAAALGVDAHDPAENLHGSARYLLTQLDRFGTPELALAAYNAGPEAVSRHAGIPPYRETQGHVRKVMALYAQSSGDET